LESAVHGELYAVFGKDELLPKRNIYIYILWGMF